MSKKATSHAQIRNILDGLFDSYTRASRLGPEPAALWCLHLEDVPLDAIQEAAYRWVKERPWPPDSFTRFRSGISYGGRKGAQAFYEPDPPGLDDFLVDYRKEGLSAVSTPKDYDDSAGRRTPAHERGVHWSIIRDIIDKKLRCPRSVAKHDIFATGDKEEQWYWLEFKRRAAGN